MDDADDEDCETFPKVQPGGSLLLAWRIKGKKVVIVGGGNVAAGRIVNCLDADARVVVVCPKDGLANEVAHRVRKGEVEHIDREFLPKDLAGAEMVLTAVDSPEASTEIYRLCKEKKIPVNVADVPPECDFYFGSQHRDGPLQIMVSTNGNGPKLANLIRMRIASQLPERIGISIEKVGELRRRLRHQVPQKEAVSQRMGWMIKVCEAWSYEQLADMDEQVMNDLLQYFDRDEVPAYESLARRERNGFNDWSSEWICSIS